MKRREFLAGLGGTAAFAFAAQAQQKLPVIGFLASSSAAAPSGSMPGFYAALKQAGFEIGKTVRFEARYADNQNDRLPALAAELVQIPCDVVIASGGPTPTLALKAATSTIPIVFAPVPDPVRAGLVASMNRPGGNITGVAALTIELDPKRLEILHGLAPTTGPIGVLYNPTRFDSATQVSGIQTAAKTLGRQTVLAGASSMQELETAFATFKERKISGLLVGADAYFTSIRAQVVALTARSGWPAIYQWREFVDIGGLASFGPGLYDSYRQVGFFAARILKGEKPADLPVMQPTKFELVINLKVARALGIDVPLPLLGLADEVIE